jgi:hypothetical protein
LAQISQHYGGRVCPGRCFVCVHAAGRCHARVMQMAHPLATPQGQCIHRVRHPDSDSSSSPTVSLLARNSLRRKRSRISVRECAAYSRASGESRANQSDQRWRAKLGQVRPKTSGSSSLTKPKNGRGGKILRRKAQLTESVRMTQVLSPCVRSAGPRYDLVFDGPSIFAERASRTTRRQVVCAT